MKTDWIKYLLIISMVAVAFTLVAQWGDFQDNRKPQIALDQSTSLSAPLQPTTTIESNANADIPQVETEVAAVAPAATQKLVRVVTDNLNVLIDTQGGSIVKVALPKYLAQLKQPDPFILLNQNEQQIYTAQSGLIGVNGTDGNGVRPVFESTKTSYTLSKGDDKLVVDLTLNQGDVKITKRFTFARDSYLIDVAYLIDNRSSQDWKANFYAQLKRDSQPVVSDTGIGMSPYLGAAIHTDDEKYRKITFDDMEESKGGIKAKVEGGWVAMVQHYFISAWIPSAETTNSYTLRHDAKSDLYYLEFTTPAVTVTSGQTGEIRASFYAGPKDVYKLEAISPYLDLTVDYGWLWFIAKPLFQFLTFIYGYIGNWGWSIIALTIVIKAIFFPLSAAQYKSMANMRKLAPLMADLKERFGDDRQKMSAEMMKLYKREKVNPMGGCLPVLVQMPVFISLYWVLMESVELRHTPFLGWIQDLSVRDPLFILPVIMGATMFLQFRLNPTPPDPTQAKVMQMMPLFMTIMFMWFPAGLVLYWVANNSISIIQQYVITRQIESAQKT